MPFPRSRLAIGSHPVYSVQQDVAMIELGFAVAATLKGQLYRDLVRPAFEFAVARIAAATGCEKPKFLGTSLTFTCPNWPWSAGPLRMMAGASNPGQRDESATLFLNWSETVESTPSETQRVEVAVRTLLAIAHVADPETYVRRVFHSNPTHEIRIDSQVSEAHPVDVKVNSPGDKIFRSMLVLLPTLPTDSEAERTNADTDKPGTD